tara:strand:- start:91 stop:444 length:354 start_codon:yes stop_codon:yes gene_type:complete
MIEFILVMASGLLLINYWSWNFSRPADNSWSSPSEKAEPTCENSCVDPYSANMKTEDEFPGLLEDVTKSLVDAGVSEVYEVDNFKIGNYSLNLRIEEREGEPGLIVKKISKLEDNVS